MSRFAIVTDGTCTLPPSFYMEHDVAVLPMHVQFGDQDYTDGADLTREKFYQLLGASRGLPGTSAPSLGECRATYERVMRDGTRDVLVITLSADLSATYSIATSSAQAIPGNLVVVDSRSVAGGLALVVSACVRARRDGRSLQEAADVARSLAGRVQVYAYIDTLEFLQKSGRATRLQAVFGSLLQIKPLVQVTGGVVEPLDRVRTRARGIQRLKEHAIQAIGTGQRVRLNVLHTNAPGAAEEVGEWAQATFHCLEFFIGEAGPTLAARVGPGCLGICFLKEEAA